MTGKSISRNLELDRLVQRVIVGALLFLAASLIAVAVGLIV
jgi:hypothetical protein